MRRLPFLGRESGRRGKDLFELGLQLRVGCRLGQGDYHASDEDERECDDGAFH